ncbi:MAG TPA: hypothetical protein VIX12_02305, partial [Candidatus Binataceae bacterium]
MTNLPRVAILADFKEEGWRSMDLVAEMLHANLDSAARGRIEAVLLRPKYIRLFAVVARTRSAENLDRLFNRLVWYPLWLIRNRKNFDVFHVIDHSYSQLVHQLPAERTIVTCHDLDTFRCLLEPSRERRSGVFRAMTAWIMSGMRKAAIVTCV